MHSHFFLTAGRYLRKMPRGKCRTKQLKINLELPSLNPSKNSCHYFVSSVRRGTRNFVKGEWRKCQ
jgi:hypothetical protein